MTTKVTNSVLDSSSVTTYVGTTAIALNRTSASQTLTGVSIDGNAETANSATTATSAENTIGVGQTWQNVSASRTENVTYTNLTSRPIFISVRFDRDDGELQLFVDSLMVGRTGSTAGPVYYTLTAIVPINSTYSVNAIGTGTLSWFELR
jgi:hypothetical protein